MAASLPMLTASTQAMGNCIGVKKDLPKMLEQFERRKQWIAHDYTFSRAALFHEDRINVNGEQYLLIISLLQVVAIGFL